MNLASLHLAHALNVFTQVYNKKTCACSCKHGVALDVKAKLSSASEGFACSQRQKNDIK